METSEPPTCHPSLTPYFPIHALTWILLLVAGCTTCEPLLRFPDTPICDLNDRVSSSSQAG
ncbi:hypothetical protein BU16DRAFT_221241 [Lophium mytilinum]|uniref:Uncharacterized protein n=1 Tax=Lophium mytilinum TaxID=390894 RepID=A0A6A6Q9F4_9PEZI|nr:hypothetical protein BU16DRAFT_221241 [Lophium mytilinum]